MKKMDNKQKETTKQNHLIQTAITAFKAGKPIIVVDDEMRENEGDLIYAAELMTEKEVVFMLQHTSGIICVPCLPEHLEKLQLPLMVSQDQNNSRHGCGFTLSVDAAAAHTGVSAADRLLAIHALASAATKPTDFVRPGHLFPLRAHSGGVLERRGHTEAAIDLCRLAGMQPVGVLAELMHADGTMMRYPALVSFAQEHHIPFLSIEQLAQYLQEKNKNEPFLKNHDKKILKNTTQAIKKSSSLLLHDAIHLPTSFGNFILLPYEDSVTHDVHLAFMKGSVFGKKNVLVRVHSECLTGDVFASQRCDCGEQLATALELLEKEGNGLLLYLRQEGRGIGLLAKLKAYHLQEKGFDTVQANELLGYPADSRDYVIAGQILSDLGISSVRLLTNNPKKIDALVAVGIHVHERIALQLPPTQHNKIYMQTKKEKLGHLFDHV